MTWTSFGFTVTSTLYAVEDEARTLWGGAAEWGDTGEEVTGIHEWLFTSTRTGTHVETDESFTGKPVEADTDGLQQQLDSSLISWLNHLKAAAEGK